MGHLKCFKRADQSSIHLNTKQNKFKCSLNMNQSKSTDYQWNLTDSNS